MSWSLGHLRQFVGTFSFRMVEVFHHLQLHRKSWWLSPLWFEMGFIYKLTNIVHASFPKWVRVYSSEKACSPICENVNSFELPARASTHPLVNQLECHSMRLYEEPQGQSFLNSPLYAWTWIFEAVHQLARLLLKPPEPDDVSLFNCEADPW